MSSPVLNTIRTYSPYLLLAKSLYFSEGHMKKCLYCIAIKLLGIYPLSQPRQDIFPARSDVMM